MKNYFRTAAVCISMMLATASAHAKVLDFEEVVIPPGGNVPLIKDYGLIFTDNRFKISSLSVTNSPLWGGAHSGSNYALGDTYSLGISIEGANFTLNSFWVRGVALIGGETVTLRGWKDGDLVLSKTFGVDETYHLETFNFAGLDSILMTGSPRLLLLDDIDIVVPSPIPEPTTYGMMMAGLGLVGFAARRKRTAA
nr:PEP-CTERM sorting domain-containing protein [uncultured Duganella sp.]